MFDFRAALPCVPSRHSDAQVSLFYCGKVVFELDSNTGLQGKIHMMLYVLGKGPVVVNERGFSYVWALSWWSRKSRGFPGAQISWLAVYQL